MNKFIIIRLVIYYENLPLDCFGTGRCSILKERWRNQNISYHFYLERQYHDLLQ
jgi:hypothetical protein